MFDFDAGKLLIIGIVALVFIPSKDLPRVLRQLGQFVSKMRRMAGEFQGQFMDAMREADMAELRKEAENLSKAASVNLAFNPIQDLQAQVNAVIESKPALAASDAAAFGAASEAEPVAGAASDLSTHTAVEGDLVEASGVSQVADHGQGPERLTALEMASEADRAEALEAVPRGA
jgi:sec-independent protein translocase protein TatB